MIYSCFYKNIFSLNCLLSFKVHVLLPNKAKGYQLIMNVQIAKFSLYLRILENK